ncbi:MAG: hypothetical protein JXI43_11675 [Tissierellales bacterium]|nr:hypothetical protein [Tissierellales bacterium]
MCRHKKVKYLGIQKIPDEPVKLILGNCANKKCGTTLVIAEVDSEIDDETAFLNFQDRMCEEGKRSNRDE